MSRLLTDTLRAQLHENCVRYCYYVSQQPLRWAAVKRRSYGPTVTFANLAFVFIAVLDLAGSAFQWNKRILGIFQCVICRNGYNIVGTVDWYFGLLLWVSRTFEFTRILSWGLVEEVNPRACLRTRAGMTGHAARESCWCLTLILPIRGQAPELGEVTSNLIVIW